MYWARQLPPEMDVLRESRTVSVQFATSRRSWSFASAFLATGSNSSWCSNIVMTAPTFFMVPSIGSSKHVTLPRILFLLGGRNEPE